MSPEQALRDRYSPKFPRLTRAEEAALMEIAARGEEREDDDEQE